MWYYALLNSGKPWKQESRRALSLLRMRSDFIKYQNKCKFVKDKGLWDISLKFSLELSKYKSYFNLSSDLMGIH